MTAQPAVSGQGSARPKPAPSRSDSSGYRPVNQNEALDADGHGDGDGDGYAGADPPGLPPAYVSASDRRYRTLTFILSAGLVTLLASNVYLSLPYFLPGATSDECQGSTLRVPQYFQTSPELWPGPTATGKAPFMAQTRTFDPTRTYVPNAPLQTDTPIEGMQEGNQSIFHLMGYLSSYSPALGFGVEEYPLPPGAELVQVQMLSRHGSRYPTSGSNVENLGVKIANATGKFKTSGPLAFLNNWKYQLGSEILVPRGREELFSSGVLHNYMYGSLYNPNSKIIVRTTTQDRMLKSAENWMAGFFGLEW
jgi:hypothetical protein